MTKTFFLILAILLNIFLLIKFDFYSKFFKIEDEPDNVRKIHKKSIKVLGGTIIIINLIFYALFFLIVDKEYLELIYDNQKNFLIFIITASSMYTIGLLDDKKNLPALNKLIFTILIISISLFFNKKLITEINFSFAQQSFFLNQFSFLFTLFCYIIFINAFNMLDGINLQSALYFFSLVLFFIIKNVHVMFFVFFIIPILFFLYFNYKNKIFLGDSGSYLIAFLLSCLIIKNYNLNNFKIEEILLLMIFPGIDLIRVFVTRLINQKSPFAGDLNHIHHIVSRKCSIIKSNVLIQFVHLSAIVTFFLFDIFFVSLLIFFSLYFF